MRDCIPQGVWMVLAMRQWLDMLRVSPDRGDSPFSLADGNLPGIPDGLEQKQKVSRTSVHLACS
jgi:hypothetical protein